MAIKGATKKNNKEKPILKSIENENNDLTSLVSNDLFWTIAGPKPKSLSILKKVINTITMATVPNSAGVSNLANIAPILLE